MSKRLEVELSSSPVPPLGVVLDGGVGLETEPLGDGSVLPGGLGQLLLNPESLLGRHLDYCCW